MKDKIEIKLAKINDVEVSLDNMSVEAFDSFMVVANSLKELAYSISNEISISIQKGSACVSVVGLPQTIETINYTIGEAVKGESDNADVAKYLREIQTQFQKESLKYYFRYGDIDVADDIRKAPRITKRRTRKTYISKPLIISGSFNTIGGNNPNYHLVQGSETLIVDCSKEQAIELKDYLYKPITCLVRETSIIDSNEKPKYEHFAILNEVDLTLFNGFLEKYQSIADFNLLEKLDLLYDYSDMFHENRIKWFEILLKSYELLFEDVNEYKTLLILTKGMKDAPEIKNLRGNVVEALEFKLNN